MEAPLAWPAGGWLRVFTTGPLTVRGALNGPLGRPLRGPFEGPGLGLKGCPPRMPKRPVEVQMICWTFHQEGLGSKLMVSWTAAQTGRVTLHGSCKGPSR